MGGGGSGSQSVTQEFKPPEYTKGGWEAYLNGQTALLNRPYEQSGIPQVAPWNEYQDTAARIMFDKAMEGTPMGNAANGAFMNIASGNMANPFAMPMADLAAQDNPYFGDPYTQQLISQNTKEMTDAFAGGTAAQSDAAAAMSGAFGGSGHQQQQTANAAALAKQVANATTGIQHQQQQVGMQGWNQGMANKMAALQGAGGMYGQDVGHMLQGAQGGLMGDAQYNQDLQGLMGAGNSMNNYVQQLLGQYNNQWATQQGYDATQYENYGNALGRASGSYGGSTTTQPGASQLGGLLGLGAGAAGLYSLFK
jgi:hypothetical protein